MSTSSDETTSVPAWTIWPARRGQSLEGAVRPTAYDMEWMPLRQSWRDAVEDRFRPGWARVRWDSEQLHVEAFLEGEGARNTATRLNERTWELGDVCEVFVHAIGAPFYVEIHVTPENQRLQVRLPWYGDRIGPPAGLPIESFMVHDPSWVQTSVGNHADGWIVHAVLPANVVLPEPGKLRPDAVFRLAVCRYDYRGDTDPVLSSTALLSTPRFHRWMEWHRAVLRAGE